jgi:hypothetical protein
LCGPLPWLTGGLPTLSLLTLYSLRVLPFPLFISFTTVSAPVALHLRATPLAIQLQLCSLLCAGSRPSCVARLTLAPASPPSLLLTARLLLVDPEQVSRPLDLLPTYHRAPRNQKEPARTLSRDFRLRYLPLPARGSHCDSSPGTALVSTRLLHFPAARASSHSPGCINRPP